MNQQLKKPLLLLAAFTGIILSCNQPQSKTGSAQPEAVATSDLLPSWNDGTSKKSIIDFVTKTTKEGSRHGSWLTNQSHTIILHPKLYTNYLKIQTHQYRFHKI